MCCSPATGSTVPSCASTIGRHASTSIPPNAFTIAANPEKSITIIRSMRSPVSSCTALTVHAGPPAAYVALMRQVVYGDV